MSDLKFEQRVNIMYIVKHRNTATERFHLLPEAYGDDFMFLAHVFEWHKRFLGSRECVEDDELHVRLRTSISFISREQQSVFPGSRR
ncbi:hypothetical protein L798_03444 [Zootermopsis nevadensis]|uniref:Uncharacterized protein n=1 Tax=Zootermopsis nevadensis TaxID=136037 RepID=A0A067QGA5_ZOONE|nr:hypothetical protein L798_03444 [Zootermopsis nevadensis]